IHYRDTLQLYHFSVGSLLVALIFLLGLVHPVAILIAAFIIILARITACSALKYFASTGQAQNRTGGCLNSGKHMRRMVFVVVNSRLIVQCITRSLHGGRHHHQHYEENRCCPHH
ncbi:hypothetical protein M758_8G069300, partial [Ceratodon purpureus]